MSKKAVKPGLRAAIECHPTCAIGADDRCEHCGAHFSEPHDPACPHADEPVDECDTARVDAETPADVEECDWDGHQSAVDEAGFCPVCQ